MYQTTADGDPFARPFAEYRQEVTGMKHQSARTMVFTALVLAVAAAGGADGGRSCSNARVAGTGDTPNGDAVPPDRCRGSFRNMGSSRWKRTDLSG
jgi:hypothetical protein